MPLMLAAAVTTACSCGFRNTFICFKCELSSALLLLVFFLLMFIRFFSWGFMLPQMGPSVFRRRVAVSVLEVLSILWLTEAIVKPRTGLFLRHTKIRSLAVPQVLNNFSLNSRVFVKEKTLRKLFFHCTTA